MRFWLLAIGMLFPSLVLFADEPREETDKPSNTPAEVIAEFNARTFDGNQIAAVPDPDFKFPESGQAIDHTSLKIGDQLPDIEGTTLAGEPFRLEVSDETKVTLVVFWSSSCAPCLHEFPFEKALLEIYKDRGFCIISVNTDAKRKLAARTAKQHGIDWPTLFDGLEGPIVNQFGIEAEPTLLLLNETGKIIASTVELRAQRFTASSPDDIVVYERGLCSALRQLLLEETQTTDGDITNP